MGNLGPSPCKDCINEHHSIRMNLDPTYPEKLNSKYKKIQELQNSYETEYINGNLDKADRIKNIINEKKQEIWNLKVSLNQQYC